MRMASYKKLKGEGILLLNELEITSKELIRKVIEFKNPERIGLSFNSPHFSDMVDVWGVSLVNEKFKDKSAWGRYEDELKEVGSFNGEVRRDSFGNIYGRLMGKTKGECIKGAIEDWKDLEDYMFPYYDISCEENIKKIIEENKDKFIVAGLPVSVFSTIRDIRKMENILADVILEKENVIRLLLSIEELGIQIIERLGALGADAVIIADDWGTQRSLFINPILWREVFKPVYRNFAEAAHKSGMKFIVHSCGYIYDIIGDFIECGVDVLQLDQPELMGVETLAKEFGGRVTFWSPVDIQKIMQTGSKDIIEAGARKMIKEFASFKGGLIAKDYPTWIDIDVDETWAQWARDIFMKESNF
jgi:uroporphyrinogen decarboxylase